MLTLQRNTLTSYDDSKNEIAGKEAEKCVGSRKCKRKIRA